MSMKKDNQSHKLVLLRLDSVHFLVYMNETILSSHKSSHFKFDFFEEK